MNAPVLLNAPKPCWRSYARFFAWLLPPVLAWGFACVFLFPKLQEIWKTTGFAEDWALQPMRIGLLITQNAWLIAALSGLCILLLEWKSVVWPKFRGAVLGTAAFLLNTAVLLIFTVMLTAVLIAAPALMKAQ